MLLILLSFIYILLTTINCGFLLTKVLRIKPPEFVVTSILGLFTITVLASGWAIFDRINLEFHTMLLFLNVTILTIYRKALKQLYLDFYIQVKILAPALQIFLALTFVLIIAQCSAAPYVIDNESYYIQTIKWLNEYGLVKGLGNLHFFLAQTSGWHFTQSALNFSFLFNGFNDISGYCLLLGNIFCIFKLHEYFKNSQRHYLIIGLLPLANVLLFQFISAPSPDIPIYVLSFFIFFYFIDCYRKPSNTYFIVVTILVLFALYIKTTAAALVVVPIILFVKNIKVYLPYMGKLSIVGAAVLILFLWKNTIISGYPLFPLDALKYPGMEYAMPEDMARLYYTFTQRCAYLVSADEYSAMNTYDLFLQWLNLPKLHGLFNKLCVILILTLPFIIYKTYNRKEIWLLFVVMLIELLLLSISSPQYRFYLNFTLLFCFLIFSLLVYKSNLLFLSLFASAALTGYVVFTPLDLNRFTNNKFVMELSNFSIDHIIIPHGNSKFKKGYEKLQEGNLDYSSPLDNTFLWGAGDGELPCVNKRQIDHFKKYYKVKPQLRSNDISDGFYSVKAE